MNRPALRAVFLDAGGTLLRPWPSVGAVYARVGARHGFHATEQDMQAAFHTAWKSLKARPHQSLTTSDKTWWRRLVFETLDTFGVAGNEASRQAYFEELYEAFAHRDAWRLDPDAPGVIQELRGRGLHVGVISNWDARLRPLLGELDLAGSLDSITVSCEVKAEKPAMKVFHAALRKAGVNAPEALHVGDSYEEDVRGAQAAGMQAVLVGRSGEAGTHCQTVSRLTEIVGCCAERV